MPRLSRWMIRLALCHAWLGFGIAGLLLMAKGIPTHLPASVWFWLPIHINLLLVGWMAQLSLGVAYWILPRLPNTLTERGRFKLAFSTPILLNLGLGIFVIGRWWDFGQILGLALEMLAILAFILHAYPRIRATFVQR